MPDDQTTLSTDTEGTTNTAPVADVSDTAAPADDATQAATEDTSAPLEAAVDAATPTPAEATEAASDEPTAPETPTDEVIADPEPVGDDSVPGTPAGTDALNPPAQDAAASAVGPDDAIVEPAAIGDTAPVEAPGTEAPVEGDPAEQAPEAEALDASTLPSVRAAAQGQDVAIEEQQSVEDAAAQRPLSAQVVPATQPAHDAMPPEAQAFMAATRPVVGDNRDPGPGQLPTAKDMGGPQEDATGVSSTLPTVATTPTVAHTPDAAIDPLAEDSANSDDAESEDDLSETQDEGSDEATEGSDASEDDQGSEDAENDDTEDEGLFGDCRTEVLPLYDLAGDGLDSIKQAAKSGQDAVAALSQVPFHLLEVEHRDHIYRLRSIIGELLTLTGMLFHRRR